MKNNIICLAAALSLLCVSCEDFIVKDLTKKHINILSPADGYHSGSLSITFWWDELDGAEEYRIQVVKPTFSLIQNIIIDTTMTDTRFVSTFSPGNYQWRIQAINNGGTTEYIYRSFTIDSTTDLSGTTVILTSPIDNYITNSASNTFKWDSVFSAEEYRFQIINIASGNTITDVTLTADTFIYSLSEGQYQWQVRAQNSSSNSPYSFHTITIDTTRPSPPSVIFPLNGDTMATSDTLMWHRDAGAIGDSLFVFNDSLLTNLFLSAYISPDTTRIFTGTIGQVYYWRLKSKDAAGNSSNFSNTFNFYVQ